MGPAISIKRPRPNIFQQKQNKHGCRLSVNVKIPRLGLLTLSIVSTATTSRSHKNTTLYTVIVNTFHFNVKRRTIRSSFSLTFTPRPQESVLFFFDNFKVCSMGHSIDFKKRKVIASCLYRKILATEVVILQTMKLPITAA